MRSKCNHLSQASETKYYSAVKSDNKFIIRLSLQFSFVKNFSYHTIDSYENVIKRTDEHVTRQVQVVLDWKMKNRLATLYRQFSCIFKF